MSQSTTRKAPAMPASSEEILQSFVNNITGIFTDQMTQLRTELGSDVKALNVQIADLRSMLPVDYARKNDVDDLRKTIEQVKDTMNERYVLMSTFNDFKADITARVETHSNRGFGVMQQTLFVFVGLFLSILAGIITAFIMKGIP